MIKGRCKEIIQGKLPRLTSTETKIAQYVLQNYEEVLQYNVAELAKNAGVSDASVVRFCRSVGYKGFQDFKINLASDVLPQDDQFNVILKKEDNAEAVCKKTFQAEENVLNRTLLGLDIKVMENVSKKISQAKKIAFFATGGSQMVVQDAVHKFLKVGISVVAYMDIDMQLMQSTLLTKEDVAICISFSGSNLRSNECMKNAKSNGAYCVAIVSQSKSPLSKIADTSIYSAHDETIFQSESVSTRIGQLAIIDCLVSIVSMYNYEAANKAMQLTREATTSNKY